MQSCFLSLTNAIHFFFVYLRKKYHWWIWHSTVYLANHTFYFVLSLCSIFFFFFLIKSRPACVCVCLSSTFFYLLVKSFIICFNKHVVFICVSVFLYLIMNLFLAHDLHFIPLLSFNKEKEGEVSHLLFHVCTELLKCMILSCIGSRFRITQS